MNSRLKIPNKDVSRLFVDLISTDVLPCEVGHARRPQKKNAEIIICRKGKNPKRKTVLVFGVQNPVLAS